MSGSTERREPGARAASTPAGADRVRTSDLGPPAGETAPAVAAGARGYTKDRQQLLRRLSRLEGQVRGIARMIERDEPCMDILQQSAALRAAVDSVTLLLLEDHVAECLKTAVRTGEPASYAEEVIDVVRRSLGRPVRTRVGAD